MGHLTRSAFITDGADATWRREEWVETEIQVLKIDMSNRVTSWGHKRLRCRPTDEGVDGWIEALPAQRMLQCGKKTIPYFEWTPAIYRLETPFPHWKIRRQIRRDDELSGKVVSPFSSSLCGPVDHHDRYVTQSGERGRKTPITLRLRVVQCRIHTHTHTHTHTQVFPTVSAYFYSGLCACMHAVPQILFTNRSINFKMNIHRRRRRRPFL